MGSLVAAGAIRVLLLAGILPRRRKLLEILLTWLFLLGLLLLTAFLRSNNLDVYLWLLFLLRGTPRLRDIRKKLFQVSFKMSILIVIVFCENDSVWFYVFMGEARPLEHLLRVVFAHFGILIIDGLAKQVFVALQAQIRVIVPSSRF